MITKITLLLFLLSTLLSAETVEDREAPDVVDDLPASVIHMPIEAIQKTVSASKKIVSPDTKENEFEMVNGVLKKKIKNIDEPTHIKLEDEAKEVENLEPKTLDSLE